MKDLFGGSGVEKVVINHILSLVPHGSNVVELGAGFVSTRELSKYYNLYSIEENYKYCNVYENVNYIHAPIVKNWYDSSIVKMNLPAKISCVLVDGPSGSGNRNGLIDNLNLFQLDEKGIWVFHDTWRPLEKELAINIANTTGKKIEHFENEDFYSIIKNY